MSGQQGPVEPGRPPGTELPMDADRAWAVLDELQEFHGNPNDPEVVRALAALKGVINTARAYVKGRSVGRFVALCQALQEPSDRPRKAEVSEEEVERYLRERDQLRITRDAAIRLGLLAP